MVGRLGQHSRHGPGILVSRHTSWCHDMVGRLGVATEKLQCGLKWCRDTVFDVATRFGLFGVATHC